MALTPGPGHPFGPQSGAEARRQLTRNPFLQTRQQQPGAEQTSTSSSAQTRETGSGFQSLFRAVSDTLNDLRTGWRSFLTGLFSDPETPRAEREKESPAQRSQTSQPETQQPKPGSQQPAAARPAMKNQTAGPSARAEEAAPHQNEEADADPAARARSEDGATARRAPQRPGPERTPAERPRNEQTRPENLPESQNRLPNLRRQTQASSLTRPDARAGAQADLAARSGAASAANPSGTTRKKETESSWSASQTSEAEGEEGEGIRDGPRQGPATGSNRLQRLQGRAGNHPSLGGRASSGPKGGAGATAYGYGAPKLGGPARLGLAQMFTLVDRRSEVEIHVPYSERSLEQRSALSGLGEHDRAVLRLWMLQMTTAGKQDGAVYLNVEQEPGQFRRAEVELVNELKAADLRAYGGITGKALDREFFAVLQSVTGKSLAERYGSAPVLYATGPLELKSRKTNGLNEFENAILRLWGSDALFRGNDPADAAMQGLSREEVQALLVADLAADGEDSLEWGLMGALDKLYYGPGSP